MINNSSGTNRLVHLSELCAPEINSSFSKPFKSLPQLNELTYSDSSVPPKFETIPKILLKETEIDLIKVKTNEKSFSSYEKILIYFEDHIIKLETVKLNQKGLKIKKNYTLDSKIGRGGSSLVYLFKCVQSSLGPLGKHKVVKRPIGSSQKKRELALNLIIKGNTVLHEQLKNPKTGETLKRIPGLITPIKGIVNINKNKEIKNKKELKFEGSALQSLYEKGNLQSRLGTLSYNQLIDAIPQLLFGLAHLHTETEKKPGRAHRDIKPGNIFLREKNGKIEYAIADLDGAHLLSSYPKDFPCTQFYFSRKDALIDINKYNMTDEFRVRLFNKKVTLLKDMNDAEKRQFSKAHDVYAMGMTLRELLTGIDISFFVDDNGPIKPLKPKQISKINLKKISLEQLSHLKGICNVINLMTHSDWKNRCSAQEALAAVENLGIKIPTYPS